MTVTGISYIALPGETTVHPIDAITAETAEKVGNSLIFGDKTYNGSTEETILVSDLGQIFILVGESTTNPTTEGATVEGHDDWAVGEVVLYNSNQEKYFNINGDNNPTSWKSFANNADMYALKSTTISVEEDGPLYIATGGTLGEDTVIAHNTVTVVTSSGYGPSGQSIMPTHGGSFTVPYFIVSQYGHITQAENHTITLPRESEYTFAGGINQFVVTVTTETVPSPTTTTVTITPEIEDNALTTTSIAGTVSAAESAIAGINGTVAAPALTLNKDTIVSALGYTPGKMSNIVAGENITITTANEKMTISATDTTYTAGNNVTIVDDVINATNTTYNAGDNVTIIDNTINATDTTYTAGDNVTIIDNTINATDTTYTAGNNVTIVDDVINATNTTYSAGDNVTIVNDVISATDTTYSAGDNITITDNVINATDTTYNFANGTNQFIVTSSKGTITTVTIIPEIKDNALTTTSITGGTLVATTAATAGISGTVGSPVITLNKDTIVSALGYTPGTGKGGVTSIVAGNNITVNSSTGNVTITAADTLYDFAGGINQFVVTPSGGTATTIIITPSIENNALTTTVITGSITASKTAVSGISGTVQSPIVTLNMDTITNALGYTPSAGQSGVNSIIAGDNISISSSTGNVTITAVDTTYTPATSVTTVGTASITGSSINYARQDHVHGITSSTITSALGYVPGTSNLVIGTAATNAAAGNHTHIDTQIAFGSANVVGTVSPDDAGCIDEFDHNRLAFLPASCIQVHYSTDGGTTWTDYGLTDAQKIAMVTTSGPSVFTSKGGSITSSNIANMRVRVRIACGDLDKNLKLYTSGIKWLINISTNGAQNCKVQIRTRTINNYLSSTETWNTIGEYSIAGWSGWNSLPAGLFGGNMTTQTDHVGQYEFIFWANTFNSSYNCNLAVIDFRLIGLTIWSYPSELARVGRLYNMDISQNATFPAQITATQFNGPATKLSNTSSIGSSIQPVYFTNAGIPTSISYTIAKSVPSNAIFTDTTYTAGDNITISNNIISATYVEATTSTTGLMSTADKTKVDSYPTATTANNGQFLTVVSGVPAWATVPSASEYTY